jgi:hypothetical protein
LNPLMGRIEFPFQDILQLFLVFPCLDFLHFLVGIMDMSYVLLGSKLPVSALVISRRGLHLYTFHHSCSHSTLWNRFQFVAISSPKILKSAGMPGKVPSKECAIKTSKCLHTD